MQIAKTKKEAKELGLKRYTTGNPCARGHFSERDIYGRCMRCGAERSAEYKKANPMNEQQRADKVEYLRAYREEKKEALKEKQQLAYQEKREQRLAAKRRDYYDNIEVMRERSRRYRAKNKEKVALRMRQWVKENRPALNAKIRERLKSDPVARCAKSMRAHLRRVIEGIGSIKKDDTYSTLGYSPKELKDHIERQFTNGMSWENYGQWHIDHIVSISQMVKSGCKDPAAINCLTNLRPLWAKENHSKSSKAQYLI